MLNFIAVYGTRAVELIPSIVLVVAARVSLFLFIALPTIVRSMFGVVWVTVGRVAWAFKGI